MRLSGGFSIAVFQFSFEDKSECRLAEAVKKVDGCFLLFSHVQKGVFLSVAKYTHALTSRSATTLQVPLLPKLKESSGAAERHVSRQKGGGGGSRRKGKSPLIFQL